MVAVRMSRRIRVAGMVNFKMITNIRFWFDKSIIITAVTIVLDCVSISKGFQFYDLGYPYDRDKEHVGQTSSGLRFSGEAQSGCEVILKT